MSSFSSSCPRPPLDIDPALLKVPPEFKREITRSILAIIGFIIVYLILIALAVALVAACVYGGFALIVAAPHFIVILIGLGIAGLGVMVLAFVFKFLFSTSNPDASDSIEIKYEDQPKLFEFIYQVAKETNTIRPKKIFLSPDVNACVFYNSSFWSMFLPVKKNLKIGMGLVNALSLSEFKAVLAHEFGHFSQRSMKVGSYVYHVNHIIHNMLYKNNNYADFLNGWASIHAIFTFFARVTIEIVKFIQWILRQVYLMVNKSYLGLSRQMEFHADLVAASVSGGNNAVSALKRIEFAGACFQFTIDECNQLFKENKISSNIYEDHRTVFRYVAQENNYSLKNGLPVLKEMSQSLSYNRINFKDQWASHPTIAERQAYLENFELYAEPVEDSAWTLFANERELKTQFTEKIYQDALEKENKAVISETEFEEMYLKHINDFSFPRVYKNFYDDRLIEVFDVEEVTGTAFSFEELFSSDNLVLPLKVKALKNDIEILKGIENKTIDTKTFDFDGMKYKSTQAAIIREQLETELQDQTEKLNGLDKNIYLFFFTTASELSVTEAIALKQLYADYFKHRKLADEYLNKINSTMQHLMPIYSGQTLQIEQIKPIIADLKALYEPAITGHLKKWLAVGAFEKDSEMKQSVEKFIANYRVYFHDNSFFDHELIELNQVITESWQCVHVFLFNQFRYILQKQAEGLTATANNPVPVLSDPLVP